MEDFTAVVVGGVVYVVVGVDEELFEVAVAITDARWDLLKIHFYLGESPVDLPVPVDAMSSMPIVSSSTSV